YGALDVAHAPCRLLLERSGLEVDGELDPREARGELVERDNTGVGEPLRHFPLDALVGLLLEDLRLELLRHAPDLGLERDDLVLVLADPIDPVHELGPLLELRPGLVDLVDRRSDVDGLLDRHPPALADTRHPLLLVLAAS